MCKIMEDMRNEAALDNARETVRRMIKDGELSLEKIARYVPAFIYTNIFDLLNHIVFIISV